MVVGSLAAWHRDWQTLHTRGCFAHDESYLRAENHDDARELLLLRFGQYQGAAQQAVNEAQERGQVFLIANDTVAYVGAKGVTVMVLQPRTWKTCYRPEGAIRAAAREPIPDVRNQIIERAAVRRVSTRASFGAAPDSPTARFEDTP